LVFGRVPLFFYCVHFWMISLSALVVYLAEFGSRALTFRVFELPDQVGFPLPVVYGIWLAVVAALYLPCLRYGAYKRAHPEKAWLSYV
ncbi:MAG TPA: hypothetical protein VH208_06965, partial [Myxococcaceae bacterium]|nr:hypothetical protein [Myxococcaceae bacterium]